MYDPDRVVEEFGMQLGEAADMYGDLDTAEDYGYVTRGYVMADRQGGMDRSHQLTVLPQAQISSYSIHCSGRDDRDRSVPGHWSCFHSSRSP